MAFCSDCGQFDESNAAKAIYHRCGLEALKLQNVKFREMLDKVADIATNEKLPHAERVNQVLSMVGRKTA